MLLQEGLERLEMVLVSNKAPVLDYLQAGLEADFLDKFFQDYNIKLPRSLKTLYQWRGGTKELSGIPDSVIEIMPFGKLFKPEELIRKREENIDYDEFANPEKYLPFAGSGEGEMFVISIESDEKVYFIDPNVRDPIRPFFKSMAAMFECIVESYNKGILKIDPVKGLISDTYDFMLFAEKFV